MSDALTVIIAFIVCLLTSAFLYLLGRKIAPRGKESDEKVTPYACGEDYPVEYIQYYIHWFYYAVFFTILEVAVMLVAFSLFAPSVALLVIIIYTIMAILAAFMVHTT